MGRIDIYTILVLTAINLATVSIALPLIMGRDISHAARMAQGSLILLTPDLLWRRWFLAESRTRLSGNV